MTKNQLMEMMPVGDPLGRRILMDPVTAVMGGTSLLSSGLGLWGASKQAKAAQKAADTQAAAAREAGRAGKEAADVSSQQTLDAIPGAQGMVSSATGSANELLGKLYRMYDDQLKPYTTAGGTAVTDLSNLSHEPGFSWDQAKDPGYQFRLREGLKAAQNSAAARGGTLGGGAERSLTRYAQGYASNEFQNSWQRFETDRNNRAAILSRLVSAGENANDQALRNNSIYGTTTSSNLMDEGKTNAGILMGGIQNAGNFRMQGANIYGNAIAGAGQAQAAGTVGAANAWANGIGNAGNAATNAAMLWALLQGRQKPGGPSPGGQQPNTGGEPLPR